MICLVTEHVRNNYASQTNQCVRMDNACICVAAKNHNNASFSMVTAILVGYRCPKSYQKSSSNCPFLKVK